MNVILALVAVGAKRRKFEFGLVNRSLRRAEPGSVYDVVALLAKGGSGLTLVVGL